MAKPKKSDSKPLPKGWERPEFAPTWKPDKVGESIIGVMQRVRMVNLPKKGDIPARRVPIYTIMTEGGAMEVWHSAGLRDLERVGMGQEVYLEYVGLTHIEGQDNEMRTYIVGVR